jgi:hypothetical protein
LKRNAAAHVVAVLIDDRIDEKLQAATVSRWEDQQQQS